VVIYVTAYADSSLLERAKLTEPYGYIVKPFNEREIKSNIEIALFKHQMEYEIRKRDAILLALGFGVEWFLRQFSESHRITLRKAPVSWRYDFQPILEQIGIAMNIDRILVFRFKPGDDGFRALTLTNEWTTEGIPSVMGSVGDSLVTAYDLGISGFIQKIQTGKPASFRLEDIPENERAFLEEYSIRIAFTIPVFVRDHIWGIVLFSNRAERTYSGEEVEAMKIAVNIIGGVISLYMAGEEPSQDETP